MQRVLIYPGQVPLETDILRAERYTMTGLGWLAQAALGTGTVVDGLACSPTGPASLTVNVAVGAIYEQETIDSTAYSSLAADTTHSIQKQGLLFDPAAFTFVAPTTPGQAQNFLIQAGYQDSDTDSTVLPYYNASNPAVAYSGPGGLGTAQNTTRKGLCVVSSKAGAAATAGTQTTPSPDAGFVGLYVVTVAYGQTQITSGNIATLATAPFIPAKLPAIPAAVLDNLWSYGLDTGSVNAMAVTLAPVPAAYTGGMEVQVKCANTNTGAATLNVNGLGNVAIIHKDGSALAAGDIVSGQVVFVIHDGTSFQLQASAGTTQFTIPYAVDSSGAANTITVAYTPAITAYIAGLLLEVKVANTNSGSTTINVNGLGAKTIKTSTGANLSASAITAGQVVFVVYDGTNFQLGLTLAGAANVLPYIADTGSVNAMVATYAPALGSLTAGLTVEVKVANTNTAAAVTLNPNGLGATPVVRSGGAPLQIGDIQAGQIAVLIYDGTNFQLLNVSARAGQTYGQAMFQYTSGTVCTLFPKFGNQITFPSGLSATIPGAGIATSSTSAYLNGTAAQTLASNTLYYAYLWNQGTTLSPNWVIDWSTTGHATDANSGIEIKSGDATRVLVGMAYLTSSNFQDGLANRLVATWFNRRQRKLQNSFTTTRSTSSNTYVEINTEIRCNFLSWGDAVPIGYAGNINSNTGLDSVYSAPSLNGTIVGTDFFPATNSSGTGSATTGGGGSSSGVCQPAEGFNYITIVGKIGANTGNWLTANNTSNLSGMVTA